MKLRLIVKHAMNLVCLIGFISFFSTQIFADSHLYITRMLADGKRSGLEVVCLSDNLAKNDCQVASTLMDHPGVTKPITKKEAHEILDQFSKNISTVPYFKPTSVTEQKRCDRILYWQFSYQKNNRTEWYCSKQKKANQLALALRSAEFRIHRMLER